MRRPSGLLMARRVVGAVLFIIGVFGAIVAVIDVFDPVGTKMADDGDPFGSPDPWYVAVAFLGAYGACAVLGLWLLFGGGKPKPR